jgi:hypothetical protein
LSEEQEAELRSEWGTYFTGFRFGENTLFLLNLATWSLQKNTKLLKNK